MVVGFVTIWMQRIVFDMIDMNAKTDCLSPPPFGGGNSPSPPLGGGGPLLSFGRGEKGPSQGGKARGSAPRVGGLALGKPGHHTGALPQSRRFASHGCPSSPQHRMRSDCPSGLSLAGGSGLMAAVRPKCRDVPVALGWTTTAVLRKQSGRGWSPVHSNGGAMPGRQRLFRASGTGAADPLASHELLAFCRVGQAVC